MSGRARKFFPYRLILCYNHSISFTKRANMFQAFKTDVKRTVIAAVPFIAVFTVVYAY